MSKWIPVDKKLPEEFEPVLVTALTDIGPYVNICMRIGDGWYLRLGENPISLQVVAWKRKPKPFGLTGERPEKNDVMVNRIMYDLYGKMKGE